jgi:hypothetical protein
MGAKSEIGWKGRTADGARREVYARKVGTAWRFFVRQRRYDLWQRLDPVPLADWLELLDAIRRRAARRLHRPEEEAHVRQSILEQFPEAEV